MFPVLKSPIAKSNRTRRSSKPSTYITIQSIFRHGIYDPLSPFVSVFL